MDRFLPQRPDGRALRWAGRWVLIVTVLAGVFAMHVLSEHDDAGGHEMGVVAMNTASISVASDQLTLRHDGALAAAESMLMPAPPGDPISRSMAECILFLAAGVALAFLVLRTLRRTRPADAGRRSPTGLRGWVQRGPPGPRPPRISLCVLRV
jgi:hypothetical protein